MQNNVNWYRNKKYCVPAETLAYIIIIEKMYHMTVSVNAYLCLSVYNVLISR